MSKHPSSNSKQFVGQAADQVKDLTALLCEAQDALRAIRHASMGLQPGVDPLVEAKRLREALEAAYELGERAYPGSRSRK